MFIINFDKIDLWLFYVDDNGVLSVVILRKYFCVEIEDGKVIDIRLWYIENYIYDDEWVIMMILIFKMLIW